MLPGKKYDPISLALILRRHIWLALVPFAVVSAVTAIVAQVLPDRYRSETLILVVPQRVPESYVKATVTARIEDRLQSLSQQIQSRTNLERLIRDFNLYPERRATVTMEEVVAEMRRDIRLEVVRGDAFRVAYIGKEPRTVMHVTDQLANLVIRENLHDREVLAEGTNRFLESQLEDARTRLMEQEKKLEEYRKRFSGELPSQQMSNAQAVQNAQLQIQSLIESINRDRDRRLIVERQVQDLEDEIAAEPPPPAPPPPSDPNGPAGGTTAQQLASARAALQALELRFKPDHPEITFWKRRIRDLERRAAAEAAEAPTPGAAAIQALTPAEAMRRKRLREIQAELDQLDSQITSKQNEERRLRSLAGGYQQRMEMAPTRESELVELTRDYGTLQTIYTNLLSKNEEAKIAASLERRQSGEQFKVLDPARLPERPYSPNRPLLTLLGIVAGLGIGIGLIALVEYRDGSFRTDDELSSVLALPVLAVIPIMSSDTERRRSLYRKLVLRTGLGATVVVGFAIVVYTLVR